MKVEIEALRSVESKFMQLPNIDKYSVIDSNDEGFRVSVEMKDGFKFGLNVRCFKRLYPANVLEMLKNKDSSDNLILVSPYISERTAEICEGNGVGYFDYAGNCWFVGHSIYLRERGNKNVKVNEQKAVSVFERSSEVSSAILRELYADLYKKWKLKYLAEKVNCSIGQVSKLMNYLIENAWAQKDPDGYCIVDPKALLKAWSEGYGKKSPVSYACYTLEKIPDFEKSIGKLQQYDIPAYLTGISGGVRYSPVVRYNKVHLYIAPEHIHKAIQILDLKEVSSGANIIIMPMDYDVYSEDSRIIDDLPVVSPVQIYLDCMQISGRGEEMAEAVLNKEIIR